MSEKVHPLTKSRVNCFRQGCKNQGDRVIHREKHGGKYLRYCRTHYRYHSAKITVLEDHRFTEAGYKKCSYCDQEDFPKEALELIKEKTDGEGDEQ